MLRRVKVFQWVKPQTPGGKYERMEKCCGYFHRFSVDYEELQSGVGSYPVAIVEYNDGTVESIFLPLIQFMEPLT